MPGHCDPPKEHRFSATNQPEYHPGRPKGARSFQTVMKELLAQQDPDGCYATPLVKRCLQLVYKAKSDQTALNALIEILDRIEGKVINKQQLSGDGEQPIIYQWAGDEPHTANSSQ